MDNNCFSTFDDHYIIYANGQGIFFTNRNFTKSIYPHTEFNTSCTKILRYSEHI